MSQELAIIFHTDSALHKMGKHPENPDRFIQPFLELKSKFKHCADFYEATPISQKMLLASHDSAYLEKLKAMLPSKGLKKIDDDTRLSPDTLLAANYAAGAQINAVDLVMSGKAQKVYCHVRPPGHHSNGQQAMGFCFYNNVVIGAQHAMNNYGLKVAILDFDAHRGNGTESLLKDNDKALICSVFERDIFPDLPLEQASNIVYTPLNPNTRSRNFRQQIKQMWWPAIEKFMPDLIYISAGFDGHHEDDISSLQLRDEDYQWVTQEAVALANRLCYGRVISSLEGGYNLDVLNRCIPAHVQALNCGTPVEKKQSILTSYEARLPKVIRQRQLANFDPEFFGVQLKKINPLR